MVYNGREHSRFLRFAGTVENVAGKANVGI